MPSLAITGERAEQKITTDNSSKKKNLVSIGLFEVCLVRVQHPFLFNHVVKNGQLMHVVPAHWGHPGECQGLETL